MRAGALLWRHREDAPGPRVGGREDTLRTVRTEDGAPRAAIEIAQASSQPYAPPGHAGPLKMGTAEKNMRVSAVRSSRGPRRRRAREKSDGRGAKATILRRRRGCRLHLLRETHRAR